MPRSIQQVFARSLERSGTARAAPVRRSLAMRLLGSDARPRHIQERPGHPSSRTNEIDTHPIQGEVRRIPNPLDAEL